MLNSPESFLATKRQLDVHGQWNWGMEACPAKAPVTRSARCLKDDFKRDTPWPGLGVQIHESWRWWKFSSFLRDRKSSWRRAQPAATRAKSPRLWKTWMTSGKGNEQYRMKTCHNPFKVKNPKVWSEWGHTKSQIFIIPSTGLFFSGCSHHLAFCNHTTAHGQTKGFKCNQYKTHTHTCEGSPGNQTTSEFAHLLRECTSTQKHLNWLDQNWPSKALGSHLCLLSYTLQQERKKKKK